MTPVQASPAPVPEPQEPASPHSGGNAAGSSSSDPDSNSSESDSDTSSEDGSTSPVAPPVPAPPLNASSDEKTSSRSWRLSSYLPIGEESNKPAPQTIAPEAIAPLPTVTVDSSESEGYFKPPSVEQPQLLSNFSDSNDGNTVPNNIKKRRRSSERRRRRQRASKVPLSDASDSEQETVPPPLPPPLPRGEKRGKTRRYREEISTAITPIPATSGGKTRRTPSLQAKRRTRESSCSSAPSGSDSEDSIVLESPPKLEPKRVCTDKKKSDTLRRLFRHGN